MIINEGSGISNPSSNSGQDCVSFCAIERSINASLLPSAIDKY